MRASFPKNHFFASRSAVSHGKSRTRRGSPLTRVFAVTPLSRLEADGALARAHGARALSAFFQEPKRRAKIAVVTHVTIVSMRRSATALPAGARRARAAAPSLYAENMESGWPQ